ncbi:thioesterase family protein [Tessaracoccus terricola]
MNLYFRMLMLWLRNRRAPRTDVWDTVTTPFRVAPSDLDVLLHMNNGKYLTIMDLGRVDLMQRAGLWDGLNQRGWYPVVAGQTITYRRSLKLGQHFDLHTRVVGLDDRWIFLEQTFAVGDVVHARAAVRARFLKRSGGSVEHDELEELVGRFPEHLEVPEWMLEWTENTRIPTNR